MTYPRAWLRRLTFRHDEIAFYLNEFQKNYAELSEEQLIGHARAAWAIALSMSARDRAEVLSMMETRYEQTSK